ncbi:hypothetical protein GW765_02305 [Candidatus Parcubacteria bacterium]|nr:hypothetical protein [Candidatus Parcubacteria bacterium]
MEKKGKAVNVKTATITELKLAFKEGYPIQGIEILAVHPGTHAEELMNLAICHTGYAEHKFPGIKNANVATLTSTVLNAAKEKLEPHERNDKDLFFLIMKEMRMLVFGVGKGMFDEHGKNGESSSLMMFAKYLGVENNPDLKTLITYLDWEDSHGNLPHHVTETATAPKRVITAAGRLMFPEMVKRSWRKVRNQPEAEQNRVLTIMMELMEDAILEAQEFPRAMKALRGEIIYKSLFKKYPNQKGKKTSELAIIHTDEPQALKAVWKLSEKRAKAVAAVLQINSTGQFQLFSNQDKTYDFKIMDTVRMLRMKEFEARGLRVPNWKEIREDTLEGSYIHYQSEAERLFNGSLTQSDVPPIIGNILTEDQVIEAVLIGLQDFVFDKVHVSVCGERNGICPAKADSSVKCPLFKAGLKRCHKKQQQTPVKNSRAPRKETLIGSKLKKELVKKSESKTPKGARSRRKVSEKGSK